ncbi:hypothetical protein Van01_16320 [Micromonospora andamanensis]|uniref:DUF1918 domain-containing protein n=1 Tax=Micromonospora andamanensis TaxID=1287068 RepID=A0ABQ4HRZ1_9ACTN|nr:hypothetical protein Van01_16320 [Micromonospora andamanensis]
MTTRPIPVVERTRPHAAHTTPETVTDPMRWRMAVRVIADQQSRSRHPGHWRHLFDADGRRYRIWLHKHIKGPDGAPLFLGDAVSILVRSRRKETRCHPSKSSSKTSNVSSTNSAGQ